MELIEIVSRSIHIISGATALAAGLLALGFFKVTKTHRTLGKVFFYSMTAVFITAIHLATVKGIDFLFCIAVLSYFSTFHGIRSLQFWKGKKAGIPDWLAISFTLLAGLYLIAKAIYSYSGSINADLILFVIFGALTVWLALGSVRRIRTIHPGDIQWFTSHRSNMGGALIATITAFSVTTMDFLPDIVAWLWPTVIISPLLTILIRQTNKVYGIKS